MKRPKHYDKPVSPWCLERHMESSGNAFVDARRTDAIEYCFRMKGDLLGDLEKARHCLDAAIEEYKKHLRGGLPSITHNTHHGDRRRR